MNRSEAAKILTKASAFDNRDATSEAAATAWAEALTDIPADPDAYAAVSRFYSESVGTEPGTRRWMEPHHLRTIRRKIRAERLSTGTLVDDGNPDETAEEYLLRRRAAERDAGDGHIPTQRPLAAIGPAPANGPQELNEDDVRALRQQKDLAQFIRDGMRAGTAANDRRKKLVLAHDDLAEQLTKAPIALVRADCWTGYLPPERLESGLLNRSPVRTQLLDLVAEAERRAA